MPQVGWLVNGQHVKHKDLLEWAGTYPKGFDYSPEMVEGMYQPTERDYVSPTMLADCPRKHYLKRAFPYYEKVEHAWNTYRGHIAHAMMEKAASEGDAILEQRRQKVIQTEAGPIMIEGTPDKVVPSQALLIDYKSIKDRDVVTKLSDDKAYKWASWKQQLSAYRWMLWPDIPIERAFIQQISMERPFRLEVPLWELEDTEVWIRARAPEFKRVLDGDVTLDTLPPVLVEGIDEKYPLCKNYCPVAARCRKLASEGK
jgi:hypothetical protein